MDEFCQLQRLLEWKLYILESLSWSSKLFIVPFLTNFIPIKTLYSVIENNCIRFEESKINQLFSLFFKTNFTINFRRVDFSKFWICFSNQPKQWTVLAWFVYFFFHLKIEFYPSNLYGKRSFYILTYLLIDLFTTEHLLTDRETQ